MIGPDTFNAGEDVLFSKLGGAVSSFWNYCDSPLNSLLHGPVALLPVWRGRSENETTKAIEA
jgi:hypothetical protein